MSQKTSRKRNMALERHIGDRVSLLRHAHQLNLEQLASAIGVSYQQIQKYEKGENRIAASTLYELAQYFDVPIETFFTDYKNPKSIKCQTVG